jgi:hypothetical protein
MLTHDELDLISRIQRYWESEIPVDDDVVATAQSDTTALIQIINRLITEWVPVEERLPENFKRVLVFINVPHRDDISGLVLGEYNNGYWEIVPIDFSFYPSEGEWQAETVSNQYVVGWMPLPEPPKED